MHSFLIFYAPFIVLIGAIIVAFITAPMDEAVRRKEDEE